MNQFYIENLNQPELKYEFQEFAYLGRSSENIVKLDSEGIENRHCFLENRSGKVFIKDLRSGGGTFINGTRIMEALLTDGDIISLGGQEFMFHDLSADKIQFGLKSKCDFWNTQLEKLSSVARTTYPVLLLGPSGTGKDIIAQALHQNSLRKNHTFLSVNCSALSETLIESELFGHIKGSFTGAIADRRGAFETARSGTLFLDEIGDLPYSLQAKLLRALENNEIRPVGSDRNIKTNVRIIAATHQNLYDKIRDGSFRSDLFYRLNVIGVHVPSLKERKEDFETLLYSFARDMRVRFSHGAISKLKKYDWPGNIRELKNVVARAAALYPKIQITELEVDTLINKSDSLINSSQFYAGGEANQTGQLSVIREIEKQIILKRLAANHGNQKRTATDLGMPKSTLNDRIRNYKINVENFKV
jgi:transcriptional regulator with GAF, ATPase, and Fis domain